MLKVKRQDRTNCYKWGIGVRANRAQHRMAGGKVESPLLAAMVASRSPQVISGTGSL
jgi:hypothetical protein